MSRHWAQGAFALSVVAAALSVAAAALVPAASPADAAAPADAVAVGGPENAVQERKVAIETSKQVYYYGDHLSFTVDVRGDGGAEGGIAYLYITHENGRTSSPVPIPLTGSLTVSTSPAAFQPPPSQYPDAPYPTGLYTLRIEYGGSSGEATFTLLDSGRIVIPSWIKDTTRLWASDKMGDATYASSIGYLISNGIIDAGAPAADRADAAVGAGEEAEGPVAIPEWVKRSAQWWVDGMIGDDAYGSSLQYLLQAGVIVV